MISKKGDIVSDKLVVIILVVLVVLGALMFMFKSNLLSYLQILPGYQLPDSKIVEGKLGEVSEGSCLDNKIALVGNVDEGLVRKLFFWIDTERPVLIKEFIFDDKEGYLDLGVSLTNNILTVQVEDEDILFVDQDGNAVKDDEIVVGRIVKKDGKNIVLIDDSVFDLGSEINQKIRVQTLLNGNKNTYDLQYVWIENIGKLQENEVYQDASNKNNRIFCREEKEFLQPIKLPFPAGEGIKQETISFRDLNFEERPWWDYWTSPLDTSLGTVEFPEELYLNDNGKIITGGNLHYFPATNSFAIKKGSKTHMAIMVDSSIWTNGDFESDTYVINKKFIFYRAPLANFRETNVKLAEGEFEELKERFEIKDEK